MYDYLIVGAGLYGSSFAAEAKKNGKICLVIEKRDTIGGNVYSEDINGIEVHKYGPHIFHTNNKKVWDFVNQYTKFNNFVNSPMAISNGDIFSLPFNMNTFTKLWNDVKTPIQAYEKIESQKIKVENKIPNFKEKALSLVGIDIYNHFIKDYTEKQWCRKCEELPGFIIDRIPLRFTYNNNYFNDQFQGIPINGYTSMIENMLSGIEVRLNENYLLNKEKYNNIAKKIIYTGAIDEYFNNIYGRLEYITLDFKTEILNISNFQGNAVMNYCDNTSDFTRVVEHKWFHPEKMNYFNTNSTIITKEKPNIWTKNKERYYPVNNEKNNWLYAKYYELSLKENNIIFGGRLGEYKYYDMDDTILSAINKFYEIENIKGDDSNGKNLLFSQS